MRICLTGGIACGKSLVAQHLNGFGVATVDADDIVHELIPDPAERRRLAAEVFADPAKRKALETKIHPVVEERLEKRLVELSNGPVPPIAIIPLLFETHWDEKYDIICAVVSEKALQVSRMMATRGYTREEAEARLAAQMPVAEKAAKSHYVIHNDGTPEELKEEVRKFLDWLKSRLAQRPA